MLKNMKTSVPMLVLVIINLESMNQSVINHLYLVIYLGVEIY
jgi:hypothetical protein